MENWISDAGKRSAGKRSAGEMLAKSQKAKEMAITNLVKLQLDAKMK